MEPIWIGQLIAIILQNSQILCKNHEKLEIIVSISVDVLGLTFFTVIVYYVIYDVSYETGLLIA